MPTILSSAKSKTLAVKYRNRPKPPNPPKYWPSEEKVDIDSTLDLFLLLNRVADDPTLWLVPGNPGAADEAGFYRRSLQALPKVKGKPLLGMDPAGLIVPDVSRLLIFDMDDGVWPARTGPETPMTEVAEELAKRLFESLGRAPAAAVVAFSGNHGFAGKGCRAKIFVIPARGLSWQTVAGLYARAGADPMMGNPAQPIFVAPPVLAEGEVDPLPNGRIWTVSASSDTMDCTPQPGDNAPRTWKTLHRAASTLRGLPVGEARHPVVNRLAFQAAGIAAGEKCPKDIVVEYLVEQLGIIDAFADRDFTDEVQRGAEDGYAQPIKPTTSEVILNDKGDPKPLLTNAVALLSAATKFVENDFGDHEISTRPPWGLSETKYPECVEEYQLRCATSWLQSHTGQAFRKTDVSDAIGMLAGAHKVNRLTEYLDICSTHPNGSLTLDNAVVVGWGAKDTPAHRLAIRRFLLQCVTRAYEPGCQGELVLVLHAPPGSGKGRSAWQLFTRPGARYFINSHLNINNQAQYAPILHGLWGAELGEQRSVSAWHHDTFKSFLSQRKIRYRKPYDTRASDIQLRVNYVWTTELETPITDDNWRRFLVVEMGKWAELPGEEIDRLWGETVRAYRAGERAYLDAEDGDVLRPARELAYSVDSLETEVRRILQSSDLEGDTRAIDTVIRTLSMRAHFGVKVSDGQIRIRVGKIMKRIGWANKVHWADGKTYRKYVPPADWKFNGQDNVEDVTRNY